MHFRKMSWKNQETRLKICFISLFCLLFLVGCEEEKDANTRQLERLEKKVFELTERLENLPVPTSGLTHLVFLNLKDELSAEEQSIFFATLNELGQINSVASFRIGHFKNVDDPRALMQYEVVLEMGFQDVSALNAYQEDEQHLAIRAKLRPYLAGPPVTYDYLTMNTSDE